MARRVVVQLVEDLDGSEIVDGEGGTVMFALDQVSSDIDLNTEHGDDLRAALQPPRIVSTSTRSTPTRQRSTNWWRSARPWSPATAWAATNDGDAGPGGQRVPHRGKALRRSAGLISVVSEVDPFWARSA